MSTRVKQEVSCIPRCDRDTEWPFGSMPACNNAKQKVRQVLQLKFRTNTHHTSRSCPTGMQDFYTHIPCIAGATKHCQASIAWGIGMHFFGNHRIARADLHKPPGKPTSLQSAGWAKNNFILTLDVRMSFHMLRVVSNKQFLKLSGLLLQLLLLQKFDKSVASLQGSCSARPRRKPLFLLGPSSGLEL